MNPQHAVDRERRFGGIARLYGAGALTRLAAARVCVIGIGGVGSWAVEALARSGVGRLSLIDLDHLAESNMNRQLHALEDTLGMAKVSAMAARVHQINPDCVVDTVEEFIDADNVASLVPSADALIDAIDNVRAKAALLALCRARGQFVVTTGAAGGRVDPTRICVRDLAHTEHDALAARLRARLRKEYAFPAGTKQPFGVPCVHAPLPGCRPTKDDSCAAPVNGAAGLACAGYGSSVAVTAGFGFAAAAQVLQHLLGAPA